MEAELANYSTDALDSDAPCDKCGGNGKAPKVAYRRPWSTNDRCRGLPENGQEHLDVSCSRCSFTYAMKVKTPAKKRT